MSPLQHHARPVANRLWITLGQADITTDIANDICDGIAP
jgi:hypothetical protein